MKDEFLDLLLSSGALKFGSFKTKSGRVSPYFFNMGAIDTGEALTKVACCYADCVLESLGALELHLFGPAYKGIPLATSVAQELSRRLGIPIPFTFNRKEIKDHGERGSFIGRDILPSSRLIIVEDVMTGGTSVRETLALVSPVGASVRAVFIGVDRQERGVGGQVAAQEVTQELGIPVFAILTLDEIISALWNVRRNGRIWIDDQLKAEIDAYRKKFG